MSDVEVTANILTTGVPSPWIDVEDYASFAAAIDAIGATERTLLISEEKAVADDKTVPSNVTLKFLQGGSLNIANTKTVTINGHVEAELYQIFKGDGSVSFGTGSVKEVYPEWWGALGDDSTDNKALFEKTLKAALTVGRVVVSEGVYLFGSTLDFSAIFDGSVHRRFSFMCHPKAEFKAFDNSVDPIINLTPASSGSFSCCEFQFGLINGNLKTVDGIKLGYISNSTIRIKQVANCTGKTGALFSIPDAPTGGFFNNLVFINRANINGHGVALRSPVAGSLGVQGNQFHLGQISNNTSNGIYVGADATKDISNRNIFYINVIEHNSAYGVRDYNGANMYFVGSSNQNTTAGIRLESGTDFTEVQGCIQDATPISDASVGKLRVNGIHDFIPFTDGDATPTVGTGVQGSYMFYPNNFRCANTGATAITAFDNGRLGQTIIVRIDSNTTITNGAPLKLAGGANFSGDSNDTIVLTQVATDVWLEVSRSVN